MFCLQSSIDNTACKNLIKKLDNLFRKIFFFFFFLETSIPRILKDENLGVDVVGSNCVEK